MSEEFDKIEQTLRRLAPRPLSRDALDGLARRLREEESPAAVQRRRLASFQRRLELGLLGAAALVLAAAGLFWVSRTGPAAGPAQPLPAVARVEPPAPTPAATQPPRPVVPVQPASVRPPYSYGTVLVRRQDEGPVVDAVWGPGRRVRYHFVDNVQWSNPAQRTAFAVTVPREEVVVVPVCTY